MLQFIILPLAPRHNFLSTPLFPTVAVLGHSSHLFTFPISFCFSPSSKIFSDYSVSPLEISLHKRNMLGTSSVQAAGEQWAHGLSHTVYCWIPCFSFQTTFSFYLKHLKNQTYCFISSQCCSYHPTLEHW